jgi:DNA-directed RNA polymerase specialized sigma24 family protein
MTLATDTDRDVPAPRGDETRLFDDHHDRLLRSVRRAINASDALIEDACSFAWVQLLRRQPDRGPMLFGWLRTTAIREAYHLSGLERRDATLDERQTPGSGEERDGLVANASDLDTRLEAMHALHLLAELPERQRRYLALFIAGYRYQEIVRLTGATYTNVNKHLTRARANVRAAQRAA